VVAPPLDSPCDRPVTYPGDSKILVKSSKGRSGPTLNMTEEKRGTRFRSSTDEIFEILTLNYKIR
jgi:hypothetical protein